jgi:hypothetical protein
MQKSSVPHVLFGCVWNAGRSQIAAAFFSLHAARVHPEVVEVAAGADRPAASPHAAGEPWCERGNQASLIAMVSMISAADSHSSSVDSSSA